MDRLAPAFFALALVLGSCDSGAIASDYIVGTWVLEASTSRLFVTARAAQEVVDPTRPGDGGIEVWGHDMATLRYAYISRTATGTAVRLGTESPLARPFIRPAASLEFPSPFSGQLIVTEGSSSGTAYFPENLANVPFFQVKEGELEVPSRPFVSHEGDTTHVGGSLLLPMRQLEAGVEGEVYALSTLDQEPPLGTSGQYVVRYVFESDGTFQVTAAATPTGTGVAFEGTWALADAGRVRIRIPTLWPDGADTFDVRIEGGILHLTRHIPCEGPICWNYVADQHALDSGVVTSARREEEVALRPGN